MEYKSSNEFIKKIETNNYELGSFDIYLENIRNIIKTNENIELEEVDQLLSTIPTQYRAAIVSKKDNTLIGFIGVYNIDNKNSKGRVYFEVNRDLSKEEQEEIYNEYYKFLKDTLNIENIEDKKYISPNKVERETSIIKASNIVLPKSNLKIGVDDKILEEYREYYDIPNLSMPITIMDGDNVVGIVGLSNLLWANKRANLNIFLDKNIDDDIAIELGSKIIDDYLDYIHSSSLYNVTTSVSGSNKNILEIMNNSNMNYYGSIPYSEMFNDKVETKYMFQHVPNMKKENGIYLPENNILNADNAIKEEKEVLDLNNGYRAISPRAFGKENIDLKETVKSHINALQHREDFASPLGEDKYFIQEGNGKYGISKALANYSYVLFDSNNNYAGYINILRENANHKNAEIEIGIKPEIQHMGLGKELLNSFYNELFRRGYASVTSAIFEFNKPSLKLHEKVAEFNGTRIDSYFINGRLWDMNFYSKVNPELESSKVK